MASGEEWQGLFVSHVMARVFPHSHDLIIAHGSGEELVASVLSVLLYRDRK